MEYAIRELKRLFENVSLSDTISIMRVVGCSKTQWQAILSFIKGHMPETWKECYGETVYAPVHVPSARISAARLPRSNRPRHPPCHRSHLFIHGSEPATFRDPCGLRLAVCLVSLPPRNHQHSLVFPLFGLPLRFESSTPSSKMRVSSLSLGTGF